MHGGFIQSLLRAERHAQVVVRTRGLRSQLDRSTEVSDRLVDLSDLLEHGTQVRVRVGKVGVDLQGLAKPRDPLIEVTLRGRDLTKIVERLDPLRFELGRLTIVIGRLLELSQ